MCPLPLWRKTLESFRLHAVLWCFASSCPQALACVTQMPERIVKKGHRLVPAIRSSKIHLRRQYDVMWSISETFVTELNWLQSRWLGNPQRPAQSQTLQLCKSASWNLTAWEHADFRESLAVDYNPCPARCFLKSPHLRFVVSCTGLFCLWLHSSQTWLCLTWTLFKVCSWK